MSEPMSPPPQLPPPSNKPTLALVLGIIGVICCGLCAPFAWYIGKKELAAIQGGQAPAEGAGLAKAGMILGIIGTILLLLSLVWVLLFGGMAVLQGISGL